jgi:hypothetical protein
MLKKEIKILEQIQKYILSNQLDKNVCLTIDRGIYGYDDRGREDFIIAFNKYKLGYIKLKFRQLREKNNLPHIELPINLLEIFYESNCKNVSIDLATKIKQLK